MCWYYWSCWPVKQKVKMEPCDVLMINLPTPTPDRGLTFVSWWIGELWYWSFGWQYFSCSCSTLATSLCSYVGYFLLCGLTQQYIYLHKCPHNAAPLTDSQVTQHLNERSRLFFCFHADQFWTSMRTNSFPTFHSPKWECCTICLVSKEKHKMRIWFAEEGSCKDLQIVNCSVPVSKKFKFPYAARTNEYPYTVPCTLQSVAYTYPVTC